MRFEIENYGAIYFTAKDKAFLSTTQHELTRMTIETIHNHSWLIRPESGLICYKWDRPNPRQTVPPDIVTTIIDHKSRH